MGGVGVKFMRHAQVFIRF